MNKKLLLLILIFGFFIRIININYPPLLWDEASIGYNAYSILKTGRDEYGRFLPYIFKSFGDYKPGLYIYLTAPFVAILGPTPLAVRLPSVILGSLLPFIFYLLIVKFFPQHKRLALIAAALTAFNPWNIHYSRGGWETNVLLFELLTAAYLFLSKKLFFSSLVFAATLYTYQGGKIMSPLLILALLFTFYKQINFKQLLIRFILPLFLLALPIAYGLFFGSDSNRLQVFGLWSYHQPETEVAEILKESGSLNYRLYHSEVVFFARNFFLRYFNYFSPRFLAFEGDWQIGRQSAPYIGAFLYPTVLFFVIGLFFTLSKPVTLLSRFFLIWLLVSPLPGALTLDIIQPVRTLSLSIAIIYFAACGIEFIINRFSKKIVYLTIFLAYLLSFIYYTDLYYSHMVKVKPDHWLYGYQSAMSYALQHSQNKTVYFSDFYGQPYIYYLFISRHDPASYQKQANLISTGLDTGKVAQVDNFIFKTPDFSYLKTVPGVLQILTYDDALRQNIDLKLLTPLSPINGHSSFYAYETP